LAYNKPYKQTLILTFSRVVNLSEEEIKIEKADSEVEDNQQVNDSVEETVEDNDILADNDNLKESEDDEVSIDFSGIKNKFKGFFSKDESKSKNSNENIETEEDELNLDISGLKDKVKGLFKNEKSNNSTEKNIEKDDESLSFDASKVTLFMKTNAKWLIPLALILIAILVSSYFRLQPAYLPITDDWAESSIYSYYKSGISNDIAQQYPNLPEQNRNALVEEEFNNFLETNSNQIKLEIDTLSQQYKNEFQDDTGQTYLLAIDPYYWYAEASNYVEYGQFGDDYNEEGERIFSLRNGREGKSTPSIVFHPLLGAWLYKLANIFNKNLSLMSVMFFMPVILIGLSLIPAFFIGRKVGGNLGGFFVAILIAVNSALLGRTPAGFSDTDSYNILFPLFITWMFIEALDAKNWKKSVLYSSLAALLCGLYATTWLGWWYIFDFILATALIYLIYQLIINYKVIKQGLLKYLLIPSIKNIFIFIGMFFFGSALFTTVFRNFSSFTMVFRGPFRVIALKEVAVSKIWPNVFTTVAEFNEVKLAAIIPQMGGNILFFLAILGIILTVTKKDLLGKIDLKYAIFLTIWLIGTAYGFTKGMRFVILMVPGFAIAVGASVGIIYQYLSNWAIKEIKINEYITKVVLVLVICILLIPSFSAASSVAKSEIPSMNDDWYEALTKIRDNTNDAIITSWWDFGHWFFAISERRVTFDGANQGERIHWVGKSLLTSDENVSVGLLRMLNCGQQEPVHVLEEFFDGDTVRAVNVLNQMMVLNDKEEAIQYLFDESLDSSQIAEIISITYCDDIIEQYYITSEDMVSKAGVWGHFGSWNFEKASMYQNTNSLSRNEAIKYLTENFGLTEEQADQYHYEIQSTSGDSWVSPWPGYLSGFSSCEKLSEEEIQCSSSTQGGYISFKIDLNSYNVSIENNDDLFPNSIVYATENSIEEKEFSGSLTGFSLVLVPNGYSFKVMVTDPLQAKSMFTQLFFFDGHGLECFEKFDDRQQVTGGRIITWKVDFDCQLENKVYFLPEEETNEETNEEANEEISEEEINAAHILISTDNRTSEEALNIIEEIRNHLTVENFAEYAEMYSEGPSAVNGGNLGWFGKGVMVTEFEEVAFALEEGEISEPVQTKFGWHLILVIEKSDN